MKAQIRVIGVGYHGCRLLDGVIACGLREELGKNGISALAEIRYIAVEANIDTLSCSSADVGFYLGSSSKKDGGQDSLKEIAVQARNVIEHVIHDAHLILILTGLDDPLECAAAAAVAASGQYKNVMTISMVSLPHAHTSRQKTVDADLAGIAKSSSALYMFPVSEDADLEDICNSPKEVSHAGTGNLIHCANVLAKFLSQPHGALVGFDYQDLRTAILGSDETLHDYPEQTVQSRYQYMRWVASLNTPPAELAAAALENLPLREAATVLIYVDGSRGFTMSHLRDLVTPIIAEAPNSAFVKYFVDVDPGAPDNALAVNLFVRTDRQASLPTSALPH